jgi:hypothetical protein
MKKSSAFWKKNFPPGAPKNFLDPYWRFGDASTPTHPSDSKSFFAVAGGQPFCSQKEVSSP